MWINGGGPRAMRLPEEIAAGADEKNWDPSLKALTAFPQVLAQMAGNLQWTSDLGNAYYNQPQDVLGAVQAMRQRAQAAGNLQSTPQEAVSTTTGATSSSRRKIRMWCTCHHTTRGMSMAGPCRPTRDFRFFGALGQFSQARRR